MADLREMIAALTTTVPLPTGINTATTAMGIDAAGDVLVYVPPDVDTFQAEGAPFLSLSGGTMTGPLILANATPVAPLEAASKSYVDASVGSVLNSPNFTGIPTAPTASQSVINNQIATTAYVHAAIAAGGTFVDAPSDGFAYGRLNGNWAQVLPLNGGGTISPGYLRLNGPAGTARPIVWSTNLSTRWQLITTADAETGNGQGSNFALYSYADNGLYIGSALSINRASGPQGQGGPYIYQLAPWRQITGGIGWPNGVIGNRQDIGQADRQPVVAMPANPFATTAGSPVITVNWPGSCNPASGWIGENAFGTQTWLLFAGATDVGGITPNGWLLAQSIIDNDHFTIRWTANATATVAAGGGNAVTVRPSYCTTTNRVTTEITFGGSGFPVQTAELYSVNPDFPPSVAGLPRYEHRWHWTVGPPDSAGATPWNLTGIEWDLTNRGHDYGYQPNIYGASQPSVAFWVGPVSLVPQFASGGGTPINWNSVYTVFSGQNDGAVTGVYQAFTAQPNSLVGEKFDPTGHGGVGVDLYGSYSGTPAFNPFSTNTGSPVVFVQMWQGEMIGQANGDQVYIPNTYTINGVTFGGGVYTMQNVNTATGTFAIVGTNNATATGSGGGAGVWMSFFDFAPYAPMQTWGMFQHGIITAPGSHFQSGAIIETQPGNAIAWSDGVHGTASINAQVDGPDIDLLLTPAGLGRVTVVGNNVTLFAGITPSDTQVNLFGYPGYGTNIYFRIGNVPRWGLFSDQTLETGGNAGSNFAISRYADNGSFLGNGIAINRATGDTTVGGRLVVAGNNVTLFGGITPSDTELDLYGYNGFGTNIYFRTSNVPRWGLFCDQQLETGGNAGSNFAISRYADNGNFIDNALAFNRATAAATMSGSLTLLSGNGLGWQSGSVFASITGTLGTPTTNMDVTLQTGGLGQFSINAPSVVMRAGNTAAILGVSSNAGFLKQIFFRSDSFNRWAIGTAAAFEGGGNGGSNFSIGRYADAGTFIAESIGINRASGAITLTGATTIAGNATLNGALTATGAGSFGGLLATTAAIQTSPGNNVQWSDGTNTSAITVGAGANADMSISPTGSGRVIMSANQLLLWGSAGTEEALDIRGGAGQLRTIYFRTSNLGRWTIVVSNAPESGGNAGSDFSIGRYADAGNFIGSPFVISRVTGNVTLSNSFAINNAAPPARPTITGSRTDGTALASLLAALVSYGMVTDTTTP